MFQKRGPIDEKVASSSSPSILGKRRCDSSDSSGVSNRLCLCDKDCFVCQSYELSRRLIDSMFRRFDQRLCSRLIALFVLYNQELKLRDCFKLRHATDRAARYGATRDLLEHQKII